jgi:hypothetical protein
MPRSIRESLESQPLSGLVLGYLLLLLAAFVLLRQSPAGLDLLAADTPSMVTSAQIFSSGNPPLYSVDARVPSR